MAKKIKTILISQPSPSDLKKSPFFELSQKLNLKIDYKKFFKIERLSSREFREQKIYLNDYASVILTSRQAVDHYFSMSKDLRFSPPDTMKYFCMSETIALYLQRYIQFRKRKIFFCNNNADDLASLMKKHEKETFLLPCSDEHIKILPDYLASKNFSVKAAVFYRATPENLTDVNLSKYDLLAFFSPFGIKVLKESFPDFKQEETVIAVFGESTANSVKESGLRLDVFAPTEQFQSMTMALEDFIVKHAKKK